MAWFVLFVAGLFEIGWAICLKLSKGFTVLGPTLGFVAFMSASVILLGFALRTIPVGTGYTVWTGIGAVGTVLVGMAVLGEPVDLRRLACIGCIIVGIIGLKVTSSS